jgi:hypothetical protein
MSDKKKIEIEIGDNLGCLLMIIVIALLFIFA